MNAEVGNRRVKSEVGMQKSEQLTMNDEYGTMNNGNQV